MKNRICVDIYYTAKIGDERMDVITNLASTMSQMGIQQDVGVAMLSKSMDSAESAGQGVQRMINSVPTPGLGGSIDIRL